MEERDLNLLPQGGPAAGGESVPVPEAGQMPEQLRAELAEIRAMDPEMTDLKAILCSEAGDSFRDYVRKGLSFLDAYTLAAREKLQTLHDRRVENALRASAAGKRHLSATASRGEGGVNVPAAEMEMIRKLNPGVSDAEIRSYYNADLKRRMRP